MRAILIILLALLWAPAVADEALFAAARGEREMALAAGAERLSPKLYREASNAYGAAEKQRDRGSDAQRVRTRLTDAIEYFRAARGAATRAAQTLAGMVAAREAASTLDAYLYASAPWKQAESRYDSAAAALERGNRDRALRRAGEAEDLYRIAELGAIKIVELGETRALLAEARNAGAGRLAPRTLAHAERLLAEAETVLEADRYNTKRARALATQARDQARLARRFAAILGATGANDRTTEDLLLAWQDRLDRIAHAAKTTISAEEDYEAATATLVSVIEAMRSQLESLERDVAARNDQLFALQDELTGLEEEMGGVAREHVALTQQLDAQAHMRRRFEEIEAMFSRDEAAVFRESDDVVLRLVGLEFGVGQSALAPAQYPLLDEVQRAIGVFPSSDILIEGHTDSRGNSERNMSLSRDRARTVRQYMLERMGLSPARIRSTGYGEGRPVANNETAEGRARNRRIDVRITPRATQDN